MNFQINKTTLSKWQKLLHFVDKNNFSDFYHDRFATINFTPEKDFTSLNDITKIPFLTRADLMQAGDNQLCFVPKEQVEIVAATSGTTSNNPLLVCHVPNPDNLGVYQMNTSRRMLVLMHPTRAGHILQRLNRMKLFGLIGDTQNIPMTLTLAARVGIEEIYTTPTLAILMRKYFDNNQEFLSQLKCIRLIGEPYTSRKKALLHELYPGLEINGRYGSAEADRLAQQCEHLGRPSATNQVFYHTISESFYYEIIDPETKKNLSFGEKGELVITTFSNLGTPLIRYQTGDLATIHQNTCSCNSPEPLLEIHGRVADDSIRAGGFDLKVEMVENPMLRLRHLIKPDFEIYLSEEYVGTRPNLAVELHLSLLEGISETSFIHEEIIREFENHWSISPTMSLKNAINHNLFQPLKVKFVKFPYAAKPIKRILLK